MKTMDKEPTFIEILALTVIGIIGGAVNYIGKYLDAVSRLPPEELRKATLFQVKHCFAQMIVSGFCGGLVGHTFAKMYPEWSYVIAGFGGVFGLQILHLSLLLGLRLFGKQTGIKVDDVDITNSPIHSTKEKDNNKEER